MKNIDKMSKRELRKEVALLRELVKSLKTEIKWRDRYDASVKQVVTHMHTLPVETIQDHYHASTTIGYTCSICDQYIEPDEDALYEDARSQGLVE